MIMDQTEYQLLSNEIFMMAKWHEFMMRGVYTTHHQNWQALKSIQLFEMLLQSARLGRILVKVKYCWLRQSETGERRE